MPPLQPPTIAEPGGGLSRPIAKRSNSPPRTLQYYTTTRRFEVGAHNVDEIYDWIKPWRQRLLVERRELQQNFRLANQSSSANGVSKDLSNQVEKLLKQTTNLSPAAEAGDDEEVFEASITVADIWRGLVDGITNAAFAAKHRQSFVPALTLPHVYLLIKAIFRGESCTW